MVKGNTITSFFAPKNPKTNNEKKRSHDDNKTNEKKQKVDNDEQLNNNEVTELLTYMNLECWKNALDEHITKPNFMKLAKFVSMERKTKTIYPPVEDTFTALNLVPISDVRVVIVGQDPYHGPNQGHGLAFSVRKTIPIPPSLLNIYKELKNDNQVSSIPKHGNLNAWAKQGILLLNSVLTVQRGNANSHAKKGWEDFTDFVISTLDAYHKEKGLVFLLWGKPASTKATRLLKNKKHTVICTSHPSPLGASKTNSPFLGSRCFSRVNDALRERGLDEIDWNVD